MTPEELADRFFTPQDAERLHGELVAYELLAAPASGRTATVKGAAKE